MKSISVRDLFAKHGLIHLWDQVLMSTENMGEQADSGHYDAREATLRAILIGIGLVSIIQTAEQREAFLRDFYKELVTPVVQENDKPEILAEVDRLTAKAKAREGTKH